MDWIVWRDVDSILRGAVIERAGDVRAQARRVFTEYPVRVAFWGSLLLSLVAVLGTATVGRDAALYIDIAQHITQQGAKVAWQSFDWPWFSFLLAGTHIALHIPLELSAYLWCGLFLAGTCALMVDCVRRQTPQAAGWACLVVLAMPAVNTFRNDIIREFGFWFFCTLTLWLALRWQERGGWVRANTIHLAIGAAVLFRLEAILLLPALGLWQLPNLFSSARRQRFVQFSLVPVVVGAIGLSIFDVFSSPRLADYLSMIDVRTIFAAFNLLSDQFANSLTYKYSRDDAGQIIFFGILATLLITFVKLMGPFAAPFALRRNWGVLRVYWRDYRPFAWAAALYVLVLVVFFMRQQFMNSRYMSFLNLLSVPFLALALAAFVGQFPRLGKVIIVLGLLVMLSNVISTGAGKTHFVEAGRWMAANTEPGAPAYFEDGRISYYAGRGYSLQVMTREQAMTEHAGDFRYFLIEARENEPWLVEWLAQHKQKIIARFANRKGATVLVVGP
ncbi:hypothetical protein [Pseudomonas sp. St316]|uniref:hypothetical protein n=1 Tax=Pseudomonas sp. St316 TaxID=2678257 RepID=UPI001BF097A6|nr:hypothetical protein [Pseudomonas sp. St316]BBP57006.1 hypothetical protein PHLH4_05960 [Pseudomonas sp. St316]